MAQPGPAGNPIADGAVFGGQVTPKGRDHLTERDLRPLAAII